MCSHRRASVNISFLYLRGHSKQRNSPVVSVEALFKLSSSVRSSFLNLFLISLTMFIMESIVNSLPLNSSASISKGKKKNKNELFIMPTFTSIKGKKKVATSRLEPRRLKQLYEYISRQILSGWYLWSYVHKNNCMSLSFVQQGFRQVSIQYTPFFHQNFKKALHKREVAAPFQTFCYALLSLFFQNYFLWAICKFSLFFFF